MESNTLLDLELIWMNYGRLERELVLQDYVDDPDNREKQLRATKSYGYLAKRKRDDELSNMAFYLTTQIIKKNKLSIFSSDLFKPSN